MKIKSDYLHAVFEPTAYPLTLNEAEKRVCNFHSETPFDAIAFTGISGAAIAFPLAAALNKPLICVRKKGVSTHSHREVEGYLDNGSYIIVDDFIVSGDTVDRIVQAIAEAGCMATPQAIYLYEPTSGEYSDEYNGIPIIQ